MSATPTLRQPPIQVTPKSRDSNGQHYGTFNGGRVRCTASGTVIPRIRQSKKARLKARRQLSH